jgi:predicted transcriptional regulator of viral defense system
MNRSTALETLTPIAAEQAGMVTSRQARRVGVPHMVMVQLSRAGDLRRLRRGVYAMAHGRATHPREDLLAAWLAVTGDELPWQRDATPRGIISHQTAAALHGLGTIIPGWPEITTARQAGQRPGIRFHTAPFDPEDWGWLDVGEIRVPVTTPGRTIVDLLLDGEELDYLERAVAQAFPGPEEAIDALVSVAHRRRRPTRTAKLIENLRSLVADS